MFATEQESDPKELFKGYDCWTEEARGLFRISREQFALDRNAKTRGTGNPSVMNKPFWKFQIGPDGDTAWSARTIFGNAEDPYADSEDPVWCFVRFGATRTKLPDRRVVCIGGEHEDSYDPDFCIYNDVIVFDAPQKSSSLPPLNPESITIYGYPTDVLKPTDFHTSTYFADPTTRKESIFIIGGLGYQGQTSRDRTNVYQLDLSNFSIRQVETSGPGPSGGTHRHKAQLIDEHGQAAIRITTNEVPEHVTKKESNESISTVAGEQSVVTEAAEMTAVEDEESNPVREDKKVLMTADQSMTFTLRIHDMRWI